MLIQLGSALAAVLEMLVARVLVTLLKSAIATVSIMPGMVGLTVSIVALHRANDRIVIAYIGF